MTLQELEKLSESLTYKGQKCFSLCHRNWRDGWGPCPAGYMYMSIWIHAIDVEDGTKAKIETGSLTAIKDLENQNESSHIAHIRDSIMLLELHEVNETMALDGVRIFDPHNMQIRKIKTEPELKVA